MGLSKKKMLVAASIAGLMSVVASANSLADSQPVTGETIPCYGVNACKGTGDCGGTGYSCAGKNACKAQGFIKLPSDICTRIADGRLTA